MQKPDQTDNFSTEDESFEPIESFYQEELESLNRLDVFTTLRCPVCLEFSLDMYIDSCQHPVCEDCIDQLFKAFGVNDEAFKGKACAKCPMCKFVMVRDRMHKLRFIREVIDMKTLACEFADKGCDFRGTFKHYHTQHKRQCQHREMACRFKPCTAKGTVLEMREHEESCEFQIVDCETCDECFILSDYVGYRTRCTST